MSVLWFYERIEVFQSFQKHFKKHFKTLQKHFKNTSDVFLLLTETRQKRYNVFGGVMIEDNTNERKLKNRV